jgi:hypothetical protein
MSIRLLVLVSFVSLFPLSVFSQITFEPSYYINNDNERIDGFIKNLDWKNNPSTIEFKSTLESDIQVLTTEDVQLFEINGYLKYLSINIEVDQSSDAASELTTSAVPNYEQKDIFLKVLIEGEASLYSFVVRNSRRYYIKVGDNPIETLEYKRFLVTNSLVRENLGYQRQLLESFICSSISNRDITKLEYKRRQLEAIFIKYNECVGSNYKTFKGKKKDTFNLTVGPRFYYTTLEVTGSADRDEVDFGSVADLTFEVVAELFLPFNNNQWSITTGLTNQEFKKNITNEFGEVSFDHHGYNIPIGLRYNRFTSEKSRFYLGSSVLVTLFGRTTIEYSYRNNASDDLSKLGILFSAGYVYNDIINAQLKFEPRRQLFALATTFETMYQTTSLTISYNLPF